jgi:hypothetical protein
VSSEPASTAKCNDSTPTGRRGQLGGRAARSRTGDGGRHEPVRVHARPPAPSGPTDHSKDSSSSIESDQPGTGGHILTVKHQPGLGTWPLCVVGHFAPLCVVAESTSMGFVRRAERAAGRARLPLRSRRPGPPRCARHDPRTGLAESPFEQVTQSGSAVAATRRQAVRRYLG